LTEDVVQGVVFVLATIVVFALGLGYVAVCDRLTLAAVATTATWFLIDRR
jgi:hypothetical protein